MSSRQRTFLKLENNRITSLMQWIWNEMMMSQLQWYGKRYGTSLDLKTHKLSDDESIAMNGKRCRATHNLKIHK